MAIDVHIEVCRGLQSDLGLMDSADLTQGEVRVEPLLPDRYSIFGPDRPYNRLQQLSSWIHSD